MARVTGVKLAELQARVDSANYSLVTMAGQTYLAYVKAMMRSPKTGNVYPRPGGRMHRASAPGEAPAKDFGVLMRNMAIDVVKVAGRGWVCTAGVKAGEIPESNNYPLKLEFGTPNVAPRPAWRPAFTPALKMTAQWAEQNLARATGATLTGTASISANTGAGEVAA